MQQTTLKAAIVAKFKSVSRFSSITGIPYDTVIETLNSEADSDDFQLLVAKVKETPDRKTDNEVTPELIDQVRARLSTYDSLKAFCLHEGFQLQFLNEFLEGKIRFVHGIRVVRLLKALEIEIPTYITSTQNDGKVSNDERGQVERTVLPGSGGAI